MGSNYAQHLADQANARLMRDDVEWAVGAGDSLYLRDKFTFTAARTRELDRHAESERLKWKAAQQTEGAPRR